MMNWLPWITLAFLVLAVLLQLWLILRPRDPAGLQALLDGVEQLHTLQERVQRDLRAELQDGARGTRQELGQNLAMFQQTLLAQSGDVARTQNEQIDTFRTQLATMQHVIGQALQTATASLAQQSQQTSESLRAGLADGSSAQDGALKRFADASNDSLQRLAGMLTDQLKALSSGNELRMTEMRQTVEQRLLALQADNEKKLEQMRQTVDEKLHATLEQRLGESFKQVAERLEQVHRGLGEMQTLAQGVGDLKRVLTNVKSRGIFGEVQLAGLLEQVFTPEQYATNVATVPGSKERVEFAIRLPGRSDDGAPVWLPVDAKFPREDYERLLDALDRAERDEAEAAAKALEQRIRDEARSISAKYLAPPHTTDFAVLFLPTEGLYAELLRRPGLMESLQRDHRVTLAGPTTLLAMLNSLQMGFRTLALEKRSSEVWTVLGAVKTEFARFGDALAKTKKKLDEASNHIESVERRARVMTRELKSVEALPEFETQALLPADPVTPDDGI